MDHTHKQYLIARCGKARLYMHRVLSQGDSYRAEYGPADCAKSASGDTPVEAIAALVYSLQYDDNGNFVGGDTPKDVQRLAGRHTS